ncbi:MAG: peptidase S24 [Chlamydiales bacterium 38-26]|nr:translesion error-prone DNA polymerase V autoproteolytic subunit [Chlamydiales bacterium]OJV08363.1 MAG: peptidase S24 [Chlamydiales bacterium 38-26]
MNKSSEYEIFRSIKGASPQSSVPLFQENVSAGFPSPAENYIENSLDLNDLMIKHPASTFFVRVQGDSMNGAGISTGDILVVDKALEASSGRIIVAIINGEFTVKRLMINAKGVFLEPANPKYRSLVISEEMDFQVWGVVTYVIHKT